jgi:hypothetical protein
MPQPVVVPPSEGQKKQQPAASWSSATASTCLPAGFVTESSRHFEKNLEGIRAPPQIAPRTVVADVGVR